jgi:zinc D-Ala-D-Ala carboxypeptidase
LFPSLLIYLSCGLMKSPKFNRQHIKSFSIVTCIFTIVIVMGLGSKRSDVEEPTAKPTFQKPSIVSQSAQTPSHIVSSPAPIPTLSAIPQENPPINLVPTKFGHFPYSEDNSDRLVNAGLFIRGTYERSELLDIEADQAFRQMAKDASIQGISLMPISGFRNIADQSELFRKQIERRGSETEAARASAPPGYSEHHTGYALDIADQQHPDTDLKLTFQETTAYRWLLENAPKYGFEQSFPLNNKQGVNFEPWHWRYFGSARAAQIFAATRQ